MSAPSAELFRLSWRSPLVAVEAIFFGALLGYAVYVGIQLSMMSMIAMLVLLAVQIVVALVIQHLLSVVAISNEGIVLYRVNRLSWSNIASVHRVSVLGLTYLRVTRKKGFSWWLPLYFHGDRPINAVLAEKAPIGNPIHSYAESTNT